tara:strand:- start:2389 stop:2565 length:177 start_codon:yes stop_codon:yes gene_type:complete
MNKDEKKIKMLFNDHITRVGKWPPSWSDIEDAIREAYWAGTSSDDEDEDIFEDEDLFS